MKMTENYAKFRPIINQRPEWITQTKREKISSTKKQTVKWHYTHMKEGKKNMDSLSILII